MHNLLICLLIIGLQLQIKILVYQAIINILRKGKLKISDCVIKSLEVEIVVNDWETHNMGKVAFFNPLDIVIHMGITSDSQNSNQYWRLTKVVCIYSRLYHIICRQHICLRTCACHLRSVCVMSILIDTDVSANEWKHFNPLQHTQMLYRKGEWKYAL